ncbi:MAG: hypothetical protein EPN97_14410 [Alphaproteobacteria bacterium]|nr:MAG: hypothetical protein EPN97_14410 [Alphaproteobacteria bacterium]
MEAKRAGLIKKLISIVATLFIFYVAIFVSWHPVFSPSIPCGYLSCQRPWKDGYKEQTEYAQNYKSSLESRFKDEINLQSIRSQLLNDGFEEKECRSWDLSYYRMPEEKRTAMVCFIKVLYKARNETDFAIFTVIRDEKGNASEKSGGVVFSMLL